MRSGGAHGVGWCDLWRPQSHLEISAPPDFRAHEFQYLQRPLEPARSPDSGPICGNGLHQYKVGGAGLTLPLQVGSSSAVRPALPVGRHQGLPGLLSIRYTVHNQLLSACYRCLFPRWVSLRQVRLCQSLSRAWKSSRNTRMGVLSCQVRRGVCHFVPATVQESPACSASP